MLMKIFAADIGGTKIKVCIANEFGEISETNEIDTESNLGGKQIINKIMKEIEKHKDLDAIGISTAGQVDPEEGKIIYANKNIPNYTGTKIKEIIEKKFNIPVKVENDVNAAALGELYFGTAKSMENFLCLTYGTGIGGAIVQNADIYRGESGIAGEFGHIVRGMNHFSGDNKITFYEDVASTTALIKKALQIDKQCVSGKELFKRIAKGNDKLQQVLNDWMDEVAMGIISLVHIFNPRVVVIGGGIMEQQIVVDTVSDIVSAYIMDSFAKVEIKKAKLGNQAGLLGAVSLHVAG